MGGSSFKSVLKSSNHLSFISCLLRAMASLRSSSSCSLILLSFSYSSSLSFLAHASCSASVLNFGNEGSFFGVHPGNGEVVLTSNGSPKAVNPPAADDPFGFGAGGRGGSAVFFCFGGSTGRLEEVKVFVGRKEPVPNGSSTSTSNFFAEDAPNGSKQSNPPSRLTAALPHGSELVRGGSPDDGKEKKGLRVQLFSLERISEGIVSERI